MLVMLCHVLKCVAYDALALGHHIRTQRLKDRRTERIVNADAFLQGDNLVPVAHRFLFAITYE